MGSYEYNKRWRAENREKHLEQKRRYNKRPDVKEKRRIREHERKRHLSKTDPMFNRNKGLRKKYGIKHTDYERMLEEQGGVCAICGTDDPGGHGGRRGTKFFHIDHCHTTGAVRGLLCQRCNNGLGCFSDDVVLMHGAIGYLQNPLKNNSKCNPCVT